MCIDIWWAIKMAKLQMTGRAIIITAPPDFGIQANKHYLNFACHIFTNCPIRDQYMGIMALPSNPTMLTSDTTMGDPPWPCVTSRPLATSGATSVQLGIRSHISTRSRRISSNHIYMHSLRCRGYQTWLPTKSGLLPVCLISMQYRQKSCLLNIHEYRLNVEKYFFFNVEKVYINCEF